MDNDVDRESTIFQELFKRFGGGESPIKQKNWKITLESPGRTLFEIVGCGVCSRYEC
jgi:hypothetical protein